MLSPRLAKDDRQDPSAHKDPAAASEYQGKDMNNDNTLADIASDLGNGDGNESTADGGAETGGHALAAGDLRPPSGRRLKVSGSMKANSPAAVNSPAAGSAAAAANSPGQSRQMRTTASMKGRSGPSTPASATNTAPSTPAAAAMKQQQLMTTGSIKPAGASPLEGRGKHAASSNATANVPISSPATPTSGGAHFAFTPTTPKSQMSNYKGGAASDQSGQGASAAEPTHDSSGFISPKGPSPEPKTNENTAVISDVHDDTRGSNAAPHNAIYKTNSNALEGAKDTKLRAEGSGIPVTDERCYEELLYRLQQFLPALRATAIEPHDFESTWAVLKVRTL